MDSTHNKVFCDIPLPPWTRSTPICPISCQFPRRAPVEPKITLFGAISIHKRSILSTYAIFNPLFLLPCVIYILGYVSWIE